MHGQPFANSSPFFKEMAVEHTHDDRPVLFFDIDNTLYSSSAKIAEAMGVRIRAYIKSLGLSEEEASNLQSQYYTQYGLSLLGLRRHHGVDPMDFHEKCDGSLPLEEMLSPDPRVRKLLEDIDRSKCRVWTLTNAYWTHAERVLRILELRDQIEGIVFCDFNLKDEDFICKPQPAFYHWAMHQAGVQDPTKCLFVDDSLSNVEGARRVGWIHSVYFQEGGHQTTEPLHINHLAKAPAKIITKDGISVISNLQQLRVVWPDIFVEAEH
ncbi:pyrimidine 5-nucleotidase [Russula earlei]|uniref:Pyrimidine 5-nucleotidase n=1 Tax=Russula earlei TaxID=71964 RepID=A0ACC0ULQ7_9AGAM|nr:pyrimidine 5-nucleotidase [Russula earlei]